MSSPFTAAILIAVLTGLAACTGSIPVAPEKDQIDADSRRREKSSGIAHREGPVQLAELGPPRVNFAGDPRLGNAEAKIGIVEFSDFQCPYCRDFHRQLFPRLKEKYLDTGIAQFIFKDFPLRIHAQAVPAAMAANCAGVQGRFWDMLDALFDGQGRLGPALYAELVRELRLDEKEFSACLGDSAREREIMQDMREARRLGITGTPSFAIGRIEGDVLIVERVAKGAPDFALFAQEIEKLQNSEAGVTPSR